MGVSASSYEDFLNQMKQRTQETVYVTEDKTIVNLNNMINLQDSDLIKRDLMDSNPEFTAQDADDYVHRLKDAGTFTFEAKKIRGGLKKQREQYLGYLEQEKVKKEKMAQQGAHEFESAFKTAASKTKSLYGGQISDAENKATVDYFLSGQFQKDLLNDADHLFEVSFFAKNKKALGSHKGMKGTRVVGDSSGEPGEFNANKFLEE